MQKRRLSVGYWICPIPISTVTLRAAMCPKIETSPASSTPFERTPPLLSIEPQRSASAWRIWAVTHGTLGLACVLAGVPLYVKTLAVISCAAHAWLRRPRRQPACSLITKGWRVAARHGAWNDCVLAAATYTRHWAELAFVADGGQTLRVLVWRDAVPPAAWRALVVHLREGHGRDEQRLRTTPTGSELDVRRHDE